MRRPTHPYPPPIGPIRRRGVLGGTRMRSIPRGGGGWTGGGVARRRWRRPRTLLNANYFAPRQPGTLLYTRIYIYIITRPLTAAARAAPRDNQ